MEGHLRALLRDVLCGYLEPDLKGVADDILLETAPEPFALAEERHAPVEVEVRDLREEPEPRARAGASGAGSGGRCSTSSRASPSPPTGAGTTPRTSPRPGLNR